MNTHDNIINTALQLFNEQGTKAVSTNHIATAIGISPGNLYYHFRNKGCFADAIWLLALFWLNYLEVGGEEVSESNLRRGSDVLGPFCSHT